MEEQGHQAQQPGPSQDPLGLDRAQFAQELQELGLLEFAEEVNFNRLTDTPGDAGPLSRPGHANSGPVGHSNPPLQPNQPYDLHLCHVATQKADIATARAIQVLHLAKVSLHQLVTSYNPRAAGSGGTDGSSKRRKTSRGADASSSRSGSKGLRHFSMKVCEKVEAKGRTTYNEVADELVNEMSRVEAVNKNGQYDEKNIRRRVYDAINVLMAMDIIQKEKKEITWKGFPRLGNHSLEKLKAERLKKIKEIEDKQLLLQDMIEHQKAVRKLLERRANRAASPNGTTQLFLPFILVQANQDATVKVKISQNMMEVDFDFYQSTFQIHDDSHVLKKMAEQQMQQQQPTFANPLAGGLALPWQGAAAASMADPTLAHLAVAAAAQAHGGALGYGYQPAAVAAFYQQQLQQQQQQQQQPGGPSSQRQGQTAQGAEAQGQLKPEQHPPSVSGQGAPGSTAVAAASAQNPTSQHAQLQAQQLHTLHLLQAQLQQQQLQAQLHAQLQHQQHTRASMASGLTLPALPAALGGHGGGLPRTGAPPSFGVLTHSGLTGAAGTGQTLQVPHLPSHLSTGGGPGPSTSAAAAAAAKAASAGTLPPPSFLPSLGAAAASHRQQPGPPHLGMPALPMLSHVPPLSSVLTMPQLPPSLAAALAAAPASQSAQQQLAAGAPQPSGQGGQSSGGGGQLSGGLAAPPPPSGLQLPQLAGPAPATAAFPLVA